MPSHPDRVRRNYVDVKMYKWESILDHEEKILISISTISIASTMSRKDAAHMIAKKIYDGILKPTNA